MRDWWVFVCLFDLHVHLCVCMCLWMYVCLSVELYPRAIRGTPPPPQVLKIAILGEKYAQDYTWYVDTILNLIRLAGDYVGEEVWFRVIQIVINRQEVQGYAAKTCFEVRI